MTKTIWTTYVDRERLLACIRDLEQDAEHHRERAHLAELALELSKANVYCDSDEIPADLVTMRSRVRLKNLSTGTALECALVYPGESDPDAQSISVLAPLGTAMLGQRIGDSFEVQLPKGVSTFQVEAIPYQPEAAGHFDL